MLRRLLIGVVLIVASCFIGHAAYVWICPMVAPARCEQEWLRTQLNLTDKQFEQIRHLHECHKKGLHCSGEAPCCTCAEATRRLIDGVSAELSPAQREKYLLLTQPCLKGQGAR